MNSCALKPLDVARAEIRARCGRITAAVRADDRVADRADVAELRERDRRDRRLVGVVHDLQVIEDPQAVLPGREAVGARRDGRVDLCGAIAEVQRGRVALVVAADERASGHPVGIVVGGDRALERDLAGRIDRRIEVGEHVRRRPDAGPAERIGRRIAGAGRVCVAARVAGGIRARREHEATERVGARREVLHQRGEMCPRGRARGAIEVDERSVDERRAGAALERELVHRLLRVLVRLDTAREAGQIDPRRVEGDAVVEVRRQPIAAVGREIATHLLGERLAGDLHLAGCEQVFARDEPRAADRRRQRRVPDRGIGSRAIDAAILVDDIGRAMAGRQCDHDRSAPHRGPIRTASYRV